MSAPTLADVRTALASVIGTALTGLSTYAYVPDNPKTPCLYVIPTGDEILAMARGSIEREFDLVILVQSTDAAEGQKLLDEYCDAFGSRSVRTVLWSNPSLSGAVSQVNVEGLTQYGFEQVGETRYFRAAIPVTVLTPGS